MLIKKKYFVVLLLVLGLSNCTESKNCELEEVNIKTIKKVQYGIWKRNKCTLFSKNADISIKITDIYEKEQKMRLFLSSDYFLAEKPIFKIYGLDDLNIELNGAGSEFSFELPVAMIDQARMYLDQTFIEITYKINGKDYYRKAIFSLKEIPEALLEIRKEC